jgi:hypothetical protein
MQRSVAFIIIAALAITAGGCGEQRSTLDSMSKAPVSVRGWVDDIRSPSDPPPISSDPLVETNRLMELFRSTTLAIEGVEFASGGFSESGTFVALDVPPGSATIIFQTDGKPDSELVLENVPASADVLIPAIFINPPNIELRDAANVIVRVPARVSERRQMAGVTVRIAGKEFPVWEVPVGQLADRREYPDRPTAPRPIGYVR